MSGRWHSGIYHVLHPEKYIGSRPPQFRSDWERVCMTLFDSNPAVTHWSSESITIPYKNPLTGKQSNYIPDFFVVYCDKFGQTKAEIVEVKPRSQTSLLEAKSKHDKLHAVINQAKWVACRNYCKLHGFAFRILTEGEIFRK